MRLDSFERIIYPGDNDLCWTILILWVRNTPKPALAAGPIAAALRDGDCAAVGKLGS